MRLLKEIRNYLGNYHVKSGVFHFYRSEFKPAADFLRRALADDERLTDADRDYARCYLTLSLLGLAERCEARGEWDDGIAELERAAEISPGFPDIHFRRAQLLERLGRVDQAVEAYREALVRHPGYLDAQTALGFCLLRAGRDEAATEALRYALALRIEKIETPFRQGLERLSASDRQGAEQFFHESFHSAPTLAREFLAKALEWMHDDAHEKALIELDRALGLNPNFPDLHNLRGIVLSDLGHHEEAIDAFRRSAALRPEHILPRLNLAFALVRAERIDEAIAEFEAILSQDPEETVATAKLDELRSGRAMDRRRLAGRGGDGA